MTTKSEAYWQGYREQAARSAAKERSRAAQDEHPGLHDIARQVSEHLGRDQGRKQRIFQRSPHVFAAMDAEELATASARELASRELTELGIDCGDGDPVQLLDMHHAGRQYARDGGKRPSSMDSAPSGANPSLDKYLEL
jgi:hypothetical protein